MRNIFIVLTATALPFLTGCASIVSGTNQSVSVVTLKVDGAPLSDANCKLMNDKGTWYTKSPGSVMVHRSFNDLSVDCHKEGYPSGFLAIKSTTKGMAAGNILFGGIIGAGVDMSTGAAYDYPNIITISMNGLSPTLDKQSDLNSASDKPAVSTGSALWNTSGNVPIKEADPRYRP